MADPDLPEIYDRDAPDGADGDAPDLLLDTTVEGPVERVAARRGDVAFAERVLRRGIAAARARGELPGDASAVYISLVLTDDAGIAALNQEYRGIDAPTDVLSFPQHEDIMVNALPAGPAGAPLLLGDIVVSLPRAEAQAQEYGHSRDRELGFLLVHGLLHLLGYDHETAEDAAIMEARQDTVLDSLGLRRDSAS